MAAALPAGDVERIRHERAAVSHLDSRAVGACWCPLNILWVRNGPKSSLRDLYIYYLVIIEFEMLLDSSVVRMRIFGRLHYTLVRNFCLFVQRLSILFDDGVTLHYFWSSFILT